jgi:hypothetical protein
MSDSDMKAADYAKEYEEWRAKYGITEWIDNDSEGYAKVQAIDPSLVWTSHSTCEYEQMTPGVQVYKNSCCWATFGWEVATVPWTSETEYVQTSATLPCEVCNPDGENEDEDNDCEHCEGNAYIQHYFD